jgi:competence protein ComEA
MTTAMKPLIRRLLVPAVLAATALCFTSIADEEADRLPAGAGKPALVKVCGECHGFENIRKQRLNKDDWSDKIGEMVEHGAKGTDEEIATLLDYLTQTFGKDSRIWMNTAPFGELKAVLKLTNAEADAIIDYRKQKGDFKQWSDVLKVPGLDAKKIETAKDKMAF